jgi:hypothetical protein
LNEIAESLGAIVVKTFSSNDRIPITHFVYSPQAPQDLPDDLRVAKLVNGCQVVSPDWLYQCKQSGKRADEGAYPVVELNQKLEVNIAEDDLPGPKGVNKLPDAMGEDLDACRMPPPIDDQALQAIVGLEKQAPTPPTSSLTPAPPSLPKGSSSISISSRGSTEPPDRRSIVGEILGKLGKETITSAMDKRRRPRGRLQGRASSNMSTYSNGSQGERAIRELDPNTPNKQDMELPMPSQEISYADPEAEKERKTVRAKLRGNTTVETPKVTKKVKTAVDVEVTSARRRGRRRA